MLKTDVSQLLLEKYGKKNPPALKAGDTVRVHQKIREGEKERVQIFEGLVIAVKHGKGLDATFTVRKIAAGGIGVERTYPVHSPNVVKVERVKSAEVSRAKLYYMRDRKGKNARFKKESNSAMNWSEPAAPEIPVETPEDLAEIVEEAPEMEEVMETPSTDVAAEEVVEETATEVVEETPEEPAEDTADAEEKVETEEPATEEVPAEDAK